MESIHFLNGKFVSEKELLISPRDLGYSRGYAVFDFLRTYQQRPFLLQKHIDRLFRSAETLALTIPWSKEQVCEWVSETLEANKSINTENVARIIISGGSSTTLVPPRLPTIVITVDAVIGCPPEEYKHGVEIRLVEFQRYRPEAKTNNYIEAVMTLKALATQNIHEVIYYSDGMVREGTRSNIFALINGRLLTPKTLVLGGITREALLDILKLSVPLEVEDFSVAALRSASEVFITATGKEVMPVTKIDGVIVGDGKVGSLTNEVMRQHQSFIDSGLW